MDRKQRAEELTAQVDGWLDDLTHQLQDGHSEEYMAMLDFYADNFHKYSFANQWLILSQNKNAVLCRGYKQWAELGCQVRQGEKAIWIRGPWLRKEIDPDTGEKVEKLVGYTALTVFDVSQVDGAENLPNTIHQLKGDEDLLYAQVVAAIERQGVVVEEKDLNWKYHGLSTPGKIQIDSKLSTREKLVVAFHELGHEYMHQRDAEKRTSRQEELEAESVSYILARQYGIESNFSRDYLLRFKEPVEGLQQSLGRIHQAVKVLSEWLEPAEEPVALAAD